MIEKQSPRGRTAQGGEGRGREREKEDRSEDGGRGGQRRKQKNRTDVKDRVKQGRGFLEGEME